MEMEEKKDKSIHIKRMATMEKISANLDNIGTGFLEPFCRYLSWMRTGSFFMLIYIGLILKNISNRCPTVTKGYITITYTNTY